ncbi:hypothetical protein [Halovenus marina]|uniref:hypothetical protein n=1 Tax=Halovenus marina TaxID=3396621 RepID=UPI003F57A27A
MVLITVVLIAYFLVSLVPRTDRMVDGYRKFVALTTLGISYLVIISLLLFVVEGLAETGSVETTLSIAVFAFLLFGLTFLYDVFDDWLRLFADAEFHTWVQLSMVLAVVVLLVVFFLLAP